MPPMRCLNELASMTACQRDHPDLAVGERAQLMLDMLDETVAAARR